VPYAAARAAPHDDLRALHADWRRFEPPPLRDGAPDCTAGTTRRRHADRAAHSQRLDAIDRRGWTPAQLVDRHLVRAGMNGCDFAVRELVWIMLAARAKPLGARFTTRRFFEEFDAAAVARAPAAATARPARRATRTARP
jgi:hypothetical protein